MHLVQQARGRAAGAQGGELLLSATTALVHALAIPLEIGFFDWRHGESFPSTSMYVFDGGVDAPAPHHPQQIARLADGEDHDTEWRCSRINAMAEASMTLRFLESTSW